MALIASNFSGRSWIHAALIGLGMSMLAGCFGQLTNAKLSDVRRSDFRRRPATETLPRVNGGQSDSGPSALPGSPVYQQRRGQLAIHSNFFLPATHPVIEDLQALRGDLTTALNLEPGGETIHLYLFRGPRELTEFTRASNAPLLDRRAYFLQTDQALCVFASWGDDIAEDLRHEVTHAYLHSRIPQPPLWLDEGIAEYFEVPRSSAGLHLDHLNLLHHGFRQSDFQVSLPRLEALDDPAQLTQADYALSWLWIHFLLSTPKTRQLLHDQLAAWSRHESPPPLSQRLSELDPLIEKRCREHFDRLYQANLPRLLDRLPPAADAKISAQPWTPRQP